MFLKGDVVTLRAIEERDADVLREMINDPNVEQMVVGWSFPVSKAAQIRWIQNLQQNDKNQRYIVDVQGSGVGMASITNIDTKNGTFVVNIKLLDKAKGKGVGYETVQLLLAYGFQELNLHCATACILDYNITSQKLFEKCGFQKDGVLRKRIYKKGEYHDLYAYSLIKEESQWK